MFTSLFPFRQGDSDPKIGDHNFRPQFSRPQVYLVIPGEHRVNTPGVFMLKLNFSYIDIVSE